MAKANQKAAAARPNVAIYARVSSKRQASIPQQIDLCRQFCERRGWRVAYILEEPGIPGTTDERPMYHRLQQLAQQGRIDHVVVWKLDRLVRSLRHLMNVAHELSQHGVGIASYTENFDMESAFGRFSFRNIASFAELESELNGERALLGKLGQAKAGRWPTQFPPYGYDLGPDRRLVKNIGEVKIVQQIFRRRARGIALTEISRWLGARGEVTKRKCTFSPQTVSSIVKNQVYLGRLQILDVQHLRPDLRVVAKATWAAAQTPVRAKEVKGAAQRRREAAIDAVFNAYLDDLNDEPR